MLKNTAMCASLVLIAGCAAFQAPENWVRADRNPADANAVTAAAAECRAQAQLAGAHNGALRPIILAQNNPYMVGSPPTPGSYQAPQVDFSPLGGVGSSLGEGIARERLIRSVMDGCMAEKGYIRA
jgi:hypothetical protein